MSLLFIITFSIISLECNSAKKVELPVAMSTLKNLKLATIEVIAATKLSMSTTKKTTTTPTTTKKTTTTPTTTKTTTTQSTTKKTTTTTTTTKPLLSSTITTDFSTLHNHTGRDISPPSNDVWIGAIIGLVIVLLTLGFILFMCKRRKYKTNTPQQDKKCKKDNGEEDEEVADNHYLSSMQTIPSGLSVIYENVPKSSPTYPSNAYYQNVYRKESAVYENYHPSPVKSTPEHKSDAEHLEDNPDQLYVDMN